MNTPKPHPPVSATKHDEVAEANMAALNPSKWIQDAMKEQLVEIAMAASNAPKPKARPKPKPPYEYKNRPLLHHEGLVNLKQSLQKGE